MKIIIAKQENIPDIVFLNSFVQKIHFEHHPEIFKPVGNDDELKKYFELVLSKELNCVLIAYLEDKPAGYIWATFDHRPDNPLTRERKQVYIHHIAVNDKFRHQRIGSALFDELNHMAREKAFSNFALDTWTFNTEAQQFFKKLGFETYNIKMWRND